jgi:hypothetical protein
MTMSGEAAAAGVATVRLVATVAAAATTARVLVRINVNTSHSAYRSRGIG